MADNENINRTLSITAETSQAQQAVSALVNDVEELKSVVSGLNDVAPRLTALSTALQKLSPTANNISRVINSLTKLEMAMRSVSSITPESFSYFSAGLKDLSVAMQPVADFGTNSLGGLINSLTKLNFAIEGVKLSDTSGLITDMEHIDTAFSTIGNYDTNINAVVNGLLKIPRAVKSINDNGGTKDLESWSKGLVTALKPLESLQKTNLSSYFTQLAKIPDIVKSIDNHTLEQFAKIIRELTVIMQPLANECNKVSNAFAKLPRNIRSASGAMVNLNKQYEKSSSGGLFSGRLGGLTRAIGQFWMVRQAISMVGSTMRNLFDESSSYVESLNLFNVAMGDATQSASEFADKVQSAMGIDKKDWMDAQGSLNMLITGFDVASDKAEIMSRNLTQLAYDYSSLMNVDPSEAFKKINSAMSGQIKGLKEYGNNVSTAMVKQTGMKYGLDGSVSSWDNATQATMRYVTIMENASKTGVMNDLARTITTPANAMRIFSQMCTQMVRAMGNVVSVILAKMIPYLQVLAQVITRVANYIATLLGFKIPKIDYSGINYGSKALDNANTNASNLDKSNKKVAKSAKKAGNAMKKMKDVTQSWDELHLMPNDSNSSSSSGSPSGGTGSGTGTGALKSLDLSASDLPTYDFFKGLETEAGTKVDAIMNKLKTLFDPISQAWADKGAPVMSAFHGTLTAISDLVGSIGNSWNTVWQNGTGKRTVELILGIITNIVATVGALARGFTEAWNNGGMGTAILQSSWNILNSVLTIIQGITKFILQIAKSINWTPILSVVLTVFQTIEGVIGFIANNIGLVIGMFAGWKIAGVLSGLAGTVSSLSIAFAPLIDAVGIVVTAFITGVSPVKILLATFMELQPIIASAVSPFTLLAVGIGALVGILAEAYTNSETFRKSVNNAITNIGKLVGSILNATVVPAFVFLKTVLLNAWKMGGKNLFDGVKTLIVAMAQCATNLINFVAPAFTALFGLISKMVLPVVKTLGTIIGTVFGGIGNILGEALKLIASIVDGSYFKNPEKAWLKLGGNIVKGLVKGVKNIWESITKFFSGIIKGVKDLFGIHSPSKVFEDIGGAIVDGLIGALKGLGDLLLKPFKAGWKLVKNLFTNPAQVFSKIKTGVTSALSNIKDTIKKPFSKGFEEAQKVFNSVTGVFGDIGSKIGTALKDVGGKIKEKFEDGKNKAKELFQAGASGIGSIFSNITSGIGSALSGVGSTIKEKFKVGTLTSKDILGSNNPETLISDAFKGVGDKIGSMITVPSITVDVNKDASKSKLDTWAKNQNPKTKATIDEVQEKIHKGKGKKATNVTLGEYVKGLKLGGATAVLTKAKTESGVQKAVEDHKFTVNVNGKWGGWKKGHAMPGITLKAKSKGSIESFLKYGKALEIAFQRSATGAFEIPNGQLFQARENGPELVGRIGSRTSVVNNNQIVESIARGVEDAMLRSLANQPQGTAQPSEIRLYLDGREIYTNQKAIRRQQGYDLGFNG